MSVLTRAATVTRRPATPADGDYLRELFAESCDHLWVLPSDVRTVLLDAQYRNRRHQLAATHPGATYQIVVADGVDAGLLILERRVDGAHIVQLAIARSHRHRGIGEMVRAQLSAEPAPRPFSR
jgi:ribosomal protein S18 acetylase RimI-like enzyme